MGDRYFLTVRCPECSDGEVYFAPTCGFTKWVCPMCDHEVDLYQYTGITYEEASNANLIMESERKPILLDKNTVAFIQIFTKYDNIDDIMFGCWDLEKGYDGVEVWEESAREFVRQLKGRWCPRFLKALIKECKNVLKNINIR